MIAEAVQAELGRRNLTVNAFSQRYGFDRNTVARFAGGGRATLEFVERWARTMNLDVNHWRELCGYPPVEPSPEDLPGQVLDHAQELTYDPDFEGYDIRHWDGADRLQGLTETDLDEINKAMRSVMSEKRRRQGRE